MEGDVMHPETARVLAGFRRTELAAQVRSPAAGADPPWARGRGPGTTGGPARLARRGQAGSARGVPGGAGGLRVQRLPHPRGGQPSRRGLVADGAAVCGATRRSPPAPTGGAAGRGRGDGAAAAGPGGSLRPACGQLMCGGSWHTAGIRELPCPAGRDGCRGAGLRRLPGTGPPRGPGWWRRPRGAAGERRRSQGGQSCAPVGTIGVTRPRLPTGRRHPQSGADCR